jgi:undecaprenol kinase
VRRQWINSFRHAGNGLRDTFRTERNFRFHVFAALVVLAAGWYAGLNRNEWLWITLAITLVLVTELLNTALESLVNLASPEYHPLAKKTKDTAAAAVLCSAVFAIVVAILIFGTHMLEYFNGRATT